MWNEEKADENRVTFAKNRGRSQGFAKPSKTTVLRGSEAPAKLGSDGPFQTTQLKIN